MPWDAPLNSNAMITEKNPMARAFVVTNGCVLFQELCNI